MSDVDRETLTFRQAEGLDALPQQLALREITPAVRARIWAVLYPSLIDGGGDWKLSRHWSEILARWHVFHEFLPADEFGDDRRVQVNLVKKIIWERDYSAIFEFLTFALRDRACPSVFRQRLASALQDSRAAYRVLGKTIYPIGSDAEAETISRALADLQASEYGGARAHLQEAGALLTKGDFAGSVRESIHSVESIAKVIEPKASTLSDALRRLNADGRINPNLKRGLSALYDYSSDEQGIRHAKVFEVEANVDEADALYMLGACAAFVSYLIVRSRPRSTQSE